MRDLGNQLGERCVARTTHHRCAKRRHRRGSDVARRLHETTTGVAAARFLAWKEKKRLSARRPRNKAVRPRFRSWRGHRLHCGLVRLDGGVAWVEAGAEAGLLDACRSGPENHDETFRQNGPAGARQMSKGGGGQGHTGRIAHRRT
jgi:hypothetical protein